MSEILRGTENKERYNVPVRLWTPQDEVENEATQQLYNVAKLPWVFHHVAVMPDCHYGKGATVGSVIAMKGAVSPATVGVDIGCGMGAIKTNVRASQLPDNLKELRLRIEELIPVGFNQHEEPTLKRSQVDQFFKDFEDLHSGVQDLEGKARRQLGTLGGGNHFIEVCLDSGECFKCAGGLVTYVNGNPDGSDRIESCVDCGGSGKLEPRVWLMLHSGSRNIGKCLAEIHIKIAQKLAHNQHLPDRDLAAFLAGTPEMDAYLHDLKWAQEYAFLNRRAMFGLLKHAFEEHVSGLIHYDAPILCHHNYVSEETHFGENVIVTRKGAIRAGLDELGIIPGSMGTKSYIVRGLGDLDSFQSASHGAGRRMSRGAAKRKFTVDDLVKQTEGVECRKSQDVLDEIPGAYKDIDKVMENQRDLVQVVAELKQVLCVKG